MKKPPKLPSSGGLLVERQKILGYLLNEQHPQGAGKAKFFRMIGFKAQEWHVLANALRKHGAERETASHTRTPFGDKYRVACEVDSPVGLSNCIVTVWIVEAKKQARLVTAYPEKKSK
jgi:hypothetical protein